MLRRVIKSLSSISTKIPPKDGVPNNLLFNPLHVGIAFSFSIYYTVEQIWKLLHQQDISHPLIKPKENTVTCTNITFDIFHKEFLDQQYSFPES